VSASDAQVFALPEVNVTATKISDTEQNTARATAVVTIQEPATQASQSVAGALAFEPNITQSGGPRSSVQSVNIRGLEGSKVLQTLDGAPQAFQSGHRASYFLDPALIKSVQVIKGPVSSIYGSGAIGGVVAQETIDPEDLLKDGQDQGGFVKLAHNANNQQQDLVAGLGVRAGAVDWLLSGYYKDGDNIKLGSGEELESSSERSQGVLLKQNWFATDTQSVGLSYRNEQLDGMVPSNGAAPINGTSVVNVLRDQSNQNAMVDYDFAAVDGAQSLNAKAYWDNVEVNEQRASDLRFDSTEQATLGASVDGMSRFGALTLLLGAETKTTDFEGQRGGTVGTRPIIPDAQVDTSGVYAQINVPIVSKLSGEFGLRYDDFSAEAENLNEKNTDDDVSGSAALVWRQNDTLTIALRFDQAFRAPSSEELFTTGSHFCMGPGFCNTFISSPDLKAEKAENKELVLKWQDSVFGADQFSVNVSLFENDVDNFIEQVVTPPSFGMGPPSAGNTYYENVDKAELKGFELELDYLLNGYQTTFAYSQTRGKDQHTGEDLLSIPADKATLQLAKYVSENAQFGTRIVHTQDQGKTNNVDANVANYDGYTTMDVFGSWSPVALNGVSLGLNIKNLTDRFYRQAWSELDATGREIVLSTTYNF